MVKVLIARPGQIPNDDVALNLVDVLKTPEGRAFLRGLSEVTIFLIKRVWFDMLKLECALLCASQYEIGKVSLCFWNYTEPLVQ